MSTALATTWFPAVAAASSTDAWWQDLQALCGNAYAGTLIRAPEDDDTFRGRTVTMHVRDCTATRVRVPLVVGDDRSRTWVFSRDGDAITLKHDHRLADGSADQMTQYGGTTSNTGSAEVQLFPADEETRRVIPGSGLRSAWLVEIQAGERFVYAANRVGTDRGFQVDFDLSRPVPAPDAPWGWID